MSRAKSSNEDKQALAKVRSYPLSDDDIRKVLGNDISILTYSDMINADSLDEILDNKGRCILLWTPKDPNFGHWCCLIKKKDHIEYCDSYGDKPDNKDVLGEGQEPHLTYLLKQTGLPVYYNTYPFQKTKGNIATCGRWACSRLIYANKSLDQFYNIVKKFKGEPDDFVSALIYSFIKK